MLPAADAVGLQFVRDMLTLDPDTRYTNVLYEPIIDTCNRTSHFWLFDANRCTAQAGLQHPFFADMPADWRTMDGKAMDGPFEPDPIELEFEYAETEATTSELRQKLLQEVEWHLQKYRAADGAAGKG